MVVCWIHVHCRGNTSTCTYIVGELVAGTTAPKRNNSALGNSLCHAREVVEEALRVVLDLHVQVQPLRALSHASFRHVFGCEREVKILQVMFMLDGGQEGHSVTLEGEGGNGMQEGKSALGSMFARGKKERKEQI